MADGPEYSCRRRHCHVEGNGCSGRIFPLVVLGKPKSAIQGGTSQASVEDDRGGIRPALPLPMWSERVYIW